MRKDFIANISHELKMPIKSIRDSADVLMQNICHGLEEQNKENMENILVSSTRSKVLIDDLLTISRLEDRKSTRLNSSHVAISYAVFCLKKKTYINTVHYIYN